MARNVGSCWRVASRAVRSPTSSSVSAFLSARPYPLPSRQSSFFSFGSRVSSCRLFASSPHGSSFLSCDGILNEEQIMLREQVRDFASKEIAPIAEKVDREDSFPRQLWPALGSFGLLGPTVPTEFGGLGLTYLEHVLIMEEISRASGSVGLSYGAHSNLCVNQIARWGTQEQKEKYLPKLVDGSFLGALAMSEAGSGSDVVSMTTTAVADGDSYVLNGTKMWITNGPQCDVLVAYARTTPPSSRPKDEKARPSLTAFLIDGTTPGFSRGPKLDKLGMRGSETSELIFKDCRIPASQVLGKSGEGVKVLMSGLDSERLVLSAGPIGLMQAAMDIVLPYVNTRKQFNKPIGQFQLVQGKLADMYTTLLSHRAFLYSVARAYSEGKAGRADCASAILSCSEKATWTALQAIQLLGGNGYVNDYPTGRLLRDAKLYEIGAGS
eukprot:GHVT01069127.1.p1 GENE.GHVT01069127.1~~GHVT01069127.1.p1  ORF type:complete len:439 (+),score=46.69 GHVT01069127.1:386-1702(+)